MPKRGPNREPGVKEAIDGLMCISGAAPLQSDGPSPTKTTRVKGPGRKSVSIQDPPPVKAADCIHEVIVEGACLRSILKPHRPILKHTSVPAAERPTRKQLLLEVSRLNIPFRVEDLVRRYNLNDKKYHKLGLRYRTPPSKDVITSMVKSALRDMTNQSNSADALVLIITVVFILKMVYKIDRDWLLANFNSQTAKFNIIPTGLIPTISKCCGFGELSNGTRQKVIAYLRWSCGFRSIRGVWQSTMNGGEVDYTHAQKYGVYFPAVSTVTS